jgi:hypothetical protein
LARIRRLHRRQVSVEPVGPVTAAGAVARPGADRTETAIISSETRIGEDSGVPDREHALSGPNSGY